MAQAELKRPMELDIQPVLTQTRPMQHSIQQMPIKTQPLVRIRFHSQQSPNFATKVQFKIQLQAHPFPRLVILSSMSREKWLLVVGSVGQIVTGSTVLREDRYVIVIRSAYAEATRSPMWTSET